MSFGGLMLTLIECSMEVGALLSQSKLSSLNQREEGTYRIHSTWSRPARISESSG